MSTNSLEANSIWRLLHLGPLTGLTILVSVSVTSWHFFAQLYFPLNSIKSVCNFVVGAILIVGMLHSFISAVLTGPGSVPSGWRPSNAADEASLMYCGKCSAFKPPRAHHCSRCERCVLKMDHHCHWLGGCVGQCNQWPFFCTVLFSVLGSVYSFTLLYGAMYRVVYSIPSEHNGQHIYLSLRGLFFVLFTMLMDLVGMIGFGPLLYQQTSCLLRNQTTIEQLIVAKARTQRDSSFVFPYDLGVWANVRQVFCEPLGNGITWQVAPNCTQYTLTHYEVTQKATRLRNATLHQIVRPYNGNYWPLFSQGLCACLAFPKNVQSRLQVNTNDRVLVIKVSKSGRWMYGQKVSGSSSQHEGWFPARCASPMVENHTQTTEQILQNQTHQEMDEEHGSSHSSEGGLIDNLPYDAEEGHESNIIANKKDK